MKKFLSILLTVTMLVSMLAVMGTTTTAAPGEYVAKGSSGYCNPYGGTYPSEGYTISFDLWCFSATDGIAFWMSRTATDRLVVEGTKAGYCNASNDEGTSYTDITWGDYDWSVSHAVTMTITTTTASVAIDGTEVNSVTGSFSPNTGFVILNTQGTGCAIDNFTLKSLDGTTTYRSEDFQESLGDWFGERMVNPYTPPVDEYVAKCDGGGYYYIGGNILPTDGTSIVYSMDVYAFGVDDYFPLWVDSSSHNRFVVGAQVGIQRGGGTCLVEADDLETVEWGAYTWQNKHTFEVHINDGGRCFITMDGVEVYSVTGTVAACGEHFHGIANGNVAIDNLTVKSLDGTTTYYSNDMQDEAPFGTKTLVPTVVVGSNAKFEGYYAIRFTDRDNAEADLFQYEFDLCLTPDEDRDTGLYMDMFFDGAAKRANIGAKVGFENDTVAYDWGAFDYTNWHTCKIKMIENGIEFYIDDVLVKTCAISGGTKGWTDCMIGNCGYPGYGYGVMDNITVTNLTQDKVVLTTDFEGDWPSGDATGSKLQLFPCASIDAHYPSPFQTITEESTCTERGTYIHKCLLCGETTETGRIDALGHDWPGYSSGDVTTAATATTDGVRTWYCNRGCNTAVTCSIPATDKYVGTIYEYTDCSDEILAKEITDAFPHQEVIENGVANITGEIDNYRYTDSEVDTYDGFSIGLDVFVTGTELLNDPSYGSCIYFWCGGSSTVANEVGYNFIDNCFYIKMPGADEERAYIDIKNNEWHNITMKFKVPYEMGEIIADAYVGLYLDGQEVLAVEGMDALSFRYDSNSNGISWRVFNVQGKLDNFTIASYDFAWASNPVAGDINADGKVNARDMLMLRKYLAQMIEITAINEANADVNLQRDGIDLNDALRLRAILSGNY